jgi:hypothetical protein
MDTVPPPFHIMMGVDRCTNNNDGIRKDKKNGLGKSFAGIIFPQITPSRDTLNGHSPLTNTRRYTATGTSCTMDDRSYEQHAVLLWSAE